MGCGSSTAGVVNQFPEPYVVEVEDIWLEVKKTCDTSATRKSWQKKLVIKRRGWKTVRIFVSSTFKDFHQEREYLVKKVRLILITLKYVCINHGDQIEIIRNVLIFYFRFI